MSTSQGPAGARKGWTLKRLALWGGGGLLVLAAISNALGPETHSSAAPDPAAPNSSMVDDLQDAMRPISRKSTIFVFAIPAGARVVDIEAAAKAQCAQHAFCQVYGWQDASQVPGAWPMLDRELAALSFSYALNRDTGHEELTWYCGSLGAKRDCQKAGAK